MTPLLPIEMARLVLGRLATEFLRIAKLWVDSGYNGRFWTWAADSLNWNVELVQHWWNGSRGRIVMPDVEPLRLPSGFHVLPPRWVVERTFAWLGHNRRLSKDYERLPVTSEAFVHTAMSRLMVRRLARQQALQREEVATF